MTSGHNNYVSQYSTYIETHLDEISRISQRLHRKILYASILDTLGRAKYPAAKNHERIVGVIDTCSEWKDKDRVSLPQLDLVFQRHKNDCQAHKFIRAKLGSWEDGMVYRAESDPLLDEMKDAFADEEFFLIRQCRYAELFLHYRHTLIHEFREPGYGMEVSTDNLTPYYLTVDDQWELTFPVQFFDWLCRRSLKGLEKYLLEAGINPHDQYGFGSNWIQNIKVLKA